MYFGRAETVERRRSRRRASRIWRRALLLVGKGALVAMLRSIDLYVAGRRDTTTQSQQDFKIAGNQFHYIGAHYTSTLSCSMKGRDNYKLTSMADGAEDPPVRTPCVRSQRVM